jgi:hypothetical protein
MLLGCALLVLFSAVASTDSLYFHIHKYRLHARAASYREHLYHTANVCLFVPQVYLMFCVRARGPLLGLAAALSAATVAVELADVFCERDSRRDLGGLTSAEYAMHFLMSGLRMGFIGAFFAGASLGEFAAPASLESQPLGVALCGWFMVVPGVAVAALHVALAFAGRRALTPGLQSAQ